VKISPNMLLIDIIPVIKSSPRNYFPVIENNNHKFLGIVYFNDIKDYIFDKNLANNILIEEVMRTDFLTISLSENLTDIQKKFDESESWSLPVVENNSFMGLISKATMLDLYRKELKAQTEK